MAGYPVSYSIQRPERYNRWTVGFRLVLAVPQLILVAAASYSSFGQGRTSGINIGGALTGLLLGLVLFAWFTILFTGRFPSSMRNTAQMLFRWSQNVSAYLLLQAAPYPPFGNEPYPLNIEIAPAEQYNRWTVFFRLILIIPHAIILIFLFIALFVITLIAWFAILFTGAYPESLYEFSVGVARWGARVAAYMYLFVDEYPPFSLAEEAGSGGLQPETA